MAGGGVVVPTAGARAAQYESRTTAAVVLICMVAASGGLLFGFDLGVTGGVASLDDFLGEFFPAVLRGKQHAAQSPYCQYDSQLLSLWTSTMFISGAVFGLVAAWVTKAKGRRVTMIVGGAAFMVGAALLAAAVHISMLFIGRVLLGVGVGFANQAVPLYISEMAPPQLRGGLNISFQMATTIGILVAQCINYGTSFLVPWGWRLSLGLAGAPAAMLFLGALCLPDTPISLIQRGRAQQGRRVLERIRGTPNVDAEFADMQDSVALSASVKDGGRRLFTRQYRPQLTFALLLPFGQQFSGINSIMFYAPQIFNTLGSGGSSSLLSAVIIGAVNVVSTLVAIFVVDRFGRRVLFLEGGCQMLLAAVATGVIMATTFSASSGISSSSAVGVLITILIFVSGYAWSWGPLAWLVPSEIHTVETRSLGQSLTVSVNFLMSFVIGQSFLSMLCGMKFGVYFFFAGWVLVMTLATGLLLPETKGVPIEEMGQLWRAHWFWRPIVTSHADRRVDKEAQMAHVDRTPLTSLDQSGGKAAGEGGGNKAAPQDRGSTCMSTAKADV